MTPLRYVLGLLLLLSSTAHVQACETRCAKTCSLGLANCVDVQDGLCAKLGELCNHGCSRQCKCHQECTDQCLAGQEKCKTDNAGSPLATLCASEGGECLSGCSANCAVEAFKADKPWVKVKAAISKVIPEGKWGVKCHV